MKQSINRLKRLLPTILVTIGSLMIANVVWPIISYQFFVAPKLHQSELISPVSLEQTVYSAPQVVPSEVTQPLQHHVTQVLGQEIDYTKASNWFPNQQYDEDRQSKITHYTLSIPAVGIEDAVVSIGGEDLSESLIQYPGTANPGQLGSPVVFGHSVLRQFYNPDKSNQRRYISIFSKIMTLQDGDEITVDYDGIRYTYQVNDRFQVKPDDVYILQQRYNNRELKLVTCVPEGTYLRRGVIVAQLQDIGQHRTIH